MTFDATIPLGEAWAAYNAPEAKHFVYLDELRESGTTNMWGAAHYLVKHFGLPHDVASKILVAWIRSFKECVPAAQRFEEYIKDREEGALLLSETQGDITMAKLVIAKPPVAAAPKIAKAPKAPKVEKAPEVAPAADGKSCFEGTIGGTKYLFDIANGEALAELVAGTPVADQAQAIGRTLVPRSKAGKYAVNLLFRQWRAAKAPATAPAA